MSEQIPFTDENLAEQLRRLGVVSAGESVAVAAVGAGNINWVRRVRTGDAGRSFVVKQARPALERFPEYRAPTERILCEARYYETVADLDLESLCPRVLHFDRDQRALVLEDLGDPDTLDVAMARGDDAVSVARSLASFLGRVHAATRAADFADRFRNSDMQKLHGEHIFDLPYRPNDFPLSPAVADRARTIWDDADLVATIDAAYARYLEPHGSLVHADVQSTNILLPTAGPKLLDAEIAHVGDPAFDLGILLAHFLLGALGGGDAGRAHPAIEAAWHAYREAHGSDGLAPFASAARYAGIEILRRTLGAARVAAVADDAPALSAVDLGATLVARPPEQPDAIGD